MEECLKERPEAYDDRRDSMAVLYYNAELFLKTKEIVDQKERRKSILEVYENVCRFMRYYHGLEKRAGR